MKAYQSIPRLADFLPTVQLGIPCIAFYKYDGSNIRAEWNKKKGWYKFGTRTRLLDKTVPVFGDAITLFNDTLADGIEKVLVDKYNSYNATVYMEFFGPHSFAGRHEVETLKYIGFDVENNDPKELVLFDVNVYKQGMLGPEKFISDFGHLKSAQVVYEGKLTQQFIQDVMDGKYPVKEGVICKGGDRHKLWMCKVKTSEYLTELKKRFPRNWEDLE
jgi:hypothetical protein